MYINPNFSTLILAGGKATRMNGHDKGLVIWQDAPLINHVLKNLPKDDVVISCNRSFDDYQQYGLAIADTTPNFAGPLAGIAAALPHCQHDWVFVVACDMPSLPSDVVLQLWQATNNTLLAVAKKPPATVTVSSPMMTNSV